MSYPVVNVPRMSPEYDDQPSGTLSRVQELTRQQRAGAITEDERVAAIRRLVAAESARHRALHG
jgi:hypothetical protein